MVDINQNENVVRPWQYSVKVEVNAKGFVQPSIHIYDDDLKEITDIAILMLERLVVDLTRHGFKVATSIANSEKLV